jgi:hypothetical protein
MPHPNTIPANFAVSPEARYERYAAACDAWGVPAQSFASWVSYWQIFAADGELRQGGNLS